YALPRPCGAAPVSRLRARDRRTRPRSPRRRPRPRANADRRARRPPLRTLARGVHARPRPRARDRDAVPPRRRRTRLDRVVRAALPPVRTLDVACGTGFLTRHLAGEVVALDASPAMLEEARRQAPDAELVLGEGLALPFADGAFDRVFTGHFYGHLDAEERR